MSFGSFEEVVTYAIEKEKEAIRTAYKGDDKVEDALKRPEVLDMLAVTVQNRKVVEYLKEKVVGK